MKKIIDVPFIGQNPDFPTGCESASAVMLLNFLHFDIALPEFIDSCLEKKSFFKENGALYGPDPREAFAGDPSSSDALGCYSPVIIRALRKIIGKPWHVIDESGSSLELLCRKYIDQGMPVMIWASIDMGATVNGPWYRVTSADREIMWISNEHCLVLIGYDESTYYFNDPLHPSGPIGFPKDTVSHRYQELGMQAIAIRRESDPIQLLQPNMGILHGHLTFCGADTSDLAHQYGTPLYLLDEQAIRSQCKLFQAESRKAFGPGAQVAYASKALSFRQIYHIMNEEHMWIDTVSRGEIYTALQAGFPASRMIFHGSAKTMAEIRAGISDGVRYFVVDSREELDRISDACMELHRTQQILLRITPGIEPHTFAAVRTGQVDSKFGLPIETGQAESLAVYAMTKKGISLKGFHCHIGSQIFDVQPFIDAAEIMLEFIDRMAGLHQFSCEVLDLGGGFGVRYMPDDPQVHYEDIIHQVGGFIQQKCAALRLPQPQIIIEPGRSIVAAAGMTLYEAQSIKEIPGYLNYVAVDGGMCDNPRYALYRSKYTVYNASRMDQPADYECTIAGRCCEGGDLIARNVRIAAPQASDIIAVAVTGAYNYSMASNYNRIPRPPVILISGGECKAAVRREENIDLIRCDQ